MSADLPDFSLKRMASTAERPDAHLFRVVEDPACHRRRFLKGVAIGGVASLIVNSETAADPQMTPVGVVFAHTGAVTSLAFTPDGEQLFSASRDGVTKSWHLSTGVMKSVRTKHEGGVNAIALSADGTLLATAGSDRQVNLWSLSRQHLLHTWTEHRGSMTGVAISPDSQHLVATSSMGQIKIWSLPDGRELADIKSESRSLTDVAIERTSRGFATVGNDGSVHFRYLPNGKRYSSAGGHEMWIHCVAISSNDLLATGGTDQRVTLRELDSVRDFSILGNHNDVVRDLAFTANGTRLITVGDDAQVKIWDTLSNQNVASFESPSPILSCAVAPNGRLLATGHVDGAIILWDLVEERLVGFLFDSQACSTDATIYRTVIEIKHYVVTFALPFGAPVPVGAELMIPRVQGTFVQPEEPNAPEPSPRQGPTAREKLDSVIAARQYYVERKRQRKAAQVQAAQLQAAQFYQWQLEQSYRYYRSSSGGGGGGSYTYCSCNTISY